MILPRSTARKRTNDKRSGATRTKARRGARRTDRRVKRRNHGPDIAKLAAAIVLPLTAFGAVGYGVALLMDGEEMDDRYCYARADQHQAVIFVDGSLQGQSPDQLRDYGTGLMQTWRDAPANTRIRIASTLKGAGSSFAEPQFTICKPAETPTEQAAIGTPEQTSPMLARVHEEARAEFEAMVNQVIADASNEAKAASYSPILEQLQAISRYSNYSGPNRSLTVITDGWNNSEAGRFCLEPGALVTFERFKNKRRYRDVEPASFEGLDVTILLVEQSTLPALRAPYCTNAEVRDFWPDYFTGNGATSVEVHRLSYADER